MPQVTTRDPGWRLSEEIDRLRAALAQRDETIREIEAEEAQRDAERALFRRSTNNALMHVLGPLYGKLWGPELEALGRAMDEHRAALARSEERERALRAALAEALSAVEIARPTLRAASLRPDTSDAAWDAMLQRWRAALPLTRAARASVALDGDTHCVDAPAAPTPAKEET
jgi:hypothetical protein